MKILAWAEARWFPLALFLLGFALYTANSGGLMLYALDEAKNAGCAREMLRSGETLVPMFNGELRTDKPPLHYYHMMLAYRVFGYTEFAARFFSAIYGALTVMLVFLFARRQWGTREGLWSALALLASVHSAFQFHFAVPDPYLLFYLTLGVFCFYEAYRQPRPAYLIGLYLSIAMGTLAKGPVAIGLPGLVFLTYLLWQRGVNWRTLRPLRPFLGAITVAIIVLPWYYAVWQATDGQWVKDFLFTHNLNRYSDTMEAHRGYGVLPILVPLIGMMPLGIFLPQALRATWQPQNPLLRLCWVAVVVYIGFFVFSKTYLPNYTVPAYPFIALLLGHFLARATQQPPKRWGLALFIFLVIAVLVPLGGYFALQTDKTLAPLAAHAFWLSSLPIGALLAWLWRKNAMRSALTLAGTGMLTIFLIYFGFYPQLDAYNPVVRTLPDMDPDRPIVYYKVMNPAYIFYLDEPVPGVKSLPELKAYLAEHPDAYVISRIGWRKEFTKIPGLTEWREAKDILEIPTTLILTYEAP